MACQVFFPSSRTDFKAQRQDEIGELAQLGERLVCNQEVTGSSPVFSTSLRSRMYAEVAHVARSAEVGPLGTSNELSRAAGR